MMKAGAIIGKTMNKNIEELQKNDEFLKKKRKHNGVNGILKEESKGSINGNGFSIKYRKHQDDRAIDLRDSDSVGSNDREVNEIVKIEEIKIKANKNNVNDILEIEDDEFGNTINLKVRSTNQQLIEDDIEYRYMFNGTSQIDLNAKSRERHKIETELGLNENEEEEIKEDSIVKIRVETNRKRKKREKSENPENVEKIEKNLDDKRSKTTTPFSVQADFIGIPTSVPLDLSLNMQSQSANLLNQSPQKLQSLFSGDFYPWLTKKSLSSRGPLKLHYEILEFYKFIKPTVEEDQLREKTYHLLKDLIKQNWPDLKVKKFGSFPNKIHLPDSDVDIVVLSENFSNLDQMKILKKITKELIERDMVDYIKIIEARVPIIRATMKETKINMDISANRKNGYEAKKVIKKVLDDFPCMRPLIYVLKYFLRQRKLNESYTGGISSFLLFNLLFSFVQFTSKIDDFKGKTLGNLLTGFLQFYSFDFNFEDVGISVRHGGYFYKKSESRFSDNRKNCLLSVENFQEIDQDVGKGSFKFRKVLDCFKQARDSLYYPSHHPIKSYLGMFIKVDSFVIERFQRLKMLNDK